MQHTKCHIFSNSTRSISIWWDRRSSFTTTENAKSFDLSKNIICIISEKYFYLKPHRTINCSQNRQDYDTKQAINDDCYNNEVQKLYKAQKTTTNNTWNSWDCFRIFKSSEQPESVSHLKKNASCLSILNQQWLIRKTRKPLYLLGQTDNKNIKFSMNWPEIVRLHLLRFSYEGNLPSFLKRTIKTQNRIKVIIKNKKAKELEIIKKSYLNK